MQPCPVRLLAHKYDRLAEQWLKDEDDDTFDALGEIIVSIDQLAPTSVTGAAFLVACALSEMDHVVRGGDAPHIRLASERRVERLLRHAFLFLADHSDELPSCWKFVLAAGDGHLQQEYLKSAA